MESYQLNQTIRKTAELLAWEEEEVLALWNRILTLSPEHQAALDPSDLGPEFEDSKGLPFFVAGLRSGLLVSRWNVVCAACGSVVESREGLQHFRQSLYSCPICSSQVDVDLETSVEVSFSPQPVFVSDSINPFDGTKEHYLAHYQSRRYLRNPTLQAHLDECFTSFSLLGLWEFGKVSFKCKAGDTFRLINLESRSVVEISVPEIPPPKPSFLDKMIKHLESTGDNRPIQTLETDLKPEGFTLEKVNVLPGRVEFWVHNQIQTSAGLLVFKTDWQEFRSVLTSHPTHAKRTLSGKRLVTDQSFRDFLLVDNLPEDFRINVTGLTILFTNLHGSAALFSSLGDESAHDHIQNHYALISREIRKYGGALVKTMGDQVMAVFSQPQDGFSAASAIQKALKSYSADQGIELQIQAALHSGKALAVKANRTLDFFGTAVNHTAKLLHGAHPGEIRLSGTFLENTGVSRLTGKLGYNCIQEDLPQDAAAELTYRCTTGN